MPSTSPIIDRTRRFFAPYLGSKSLADEDEIFTGGIVNSMMAIQLITFLESEFQVKIGSDDLRIENFNTLGRIETFVRSRQGA